jgi:HEAT repeat protein
MKKCFVAVLMLLMLSAGSALSQTPQQDRPSTIEDVFLRQQIEMQILASQARSNEYESKLLALQTIRRLHESGSFHASPETFGIVQSLATEGTSHQIRQSGRVINNYPVVRKEAAALLGDIGGREAQEVLLKVVRDDPETMVLAEAIYSLGKIGPGENADAVAEHIVFTLLRENARLSPDNNLALATLFSLQRLFEAGMQFRDPVRLRETIELIIDISTNYRYITMVRERAHDVLAELAATN